MASMNTVFAIYENLERVDQSVADLKANGFVGDHITVLHPNNSDTREFAARNHTRVPPGNRTRPVR
jgi:hypothetical protein